MGSTGEACSGDPHMWQTPGMVPQVPGTRGTAGSGVPGDASPEGQSSALCERGMQERADQDEGGRRNSAYDDGHTCAGRPLEVPAQLQNLHMIVYLSCGYNALERDTQVMLKSGAWRVDYVKAFWFFPFTDSIETLVVFRRVFQEN